MEIIIQAAGTSFFISTRAETDGIILDESCIRKQFGGIESGNQGSFVIASTAGDEFGFFSFADKFGFEGVFGRPFSSRRDHIGVGINPNHGSLAVSDANFRDASIAGIDFKAVIFS